jgi:hypothetical protein
VKDDQNPFRNDFTVFFLKNVVLYEIYSVKSRVTKCPFDCTSGNYREKTSHNKQIYTLNKNLLNFENEFIDIENH